MPNTKVISTEKEPLCTASFVKNTDTDQWEPLYTSSNNLNVDLANIEKSAFSKLKVAQEHIDFVEKYVPFISGREWTRTVTGPSSAIAVYNGALKLSSGTSAGLARLESKTVQRYTPAVGKVIRFSVILGDTGEAGNVREWGYGDDSNGYFFRLNGTTLQFVRKQGGSEYTVNASSWDTPVTADGNGHLWYIQFQWLGVGNIYLYYDGNIVHTVKYLGTSTNLSIYRPDQKVRITNQNTSATSGSHDLLVGCSAVQSEGQVEGALARYFIDGNTALVAVSQYSTFTHLMTLDFKSTRVIGGNTETNDRRAEIRKIIVAGDKDSWVRISRNGTVASGTNNNIMAVSTPGVKPGVSVTGTDATGSGYANGDSITYKYTATGTTGETAASPASDAAAAGTPKKQITVTWNRLTDAVSYKLYRQVNSGSYYLIAELPYNQFTYTDNADTARADTAPSTNDTNSDSFAVRTTGGTLSGADVMMVFAVPAGSSQVINFTKELYLNSGETLNIEGAGMSAASNMIASAGWTEF